MQINSQFAEFESCNKIWAIGSIHSQLDSFENIKNHIINNFSESDKIVFLGNVIGVGDFAQETLSSVINMRSKLMSKFFLKPKDIVFLFWNQKCPKTSSPSVVKYHHRKVI